MSRTWFALLAGPFVSGCLFGIPNEIDEQAFAKQAAQVLCNRIRECNRAQYELSYFGEGDCEDEQQAALDLVVDGASDIGCDYDAAGAGEALRDINDMGCQDFFEGEWVETYELIWPDCAI